jgi:hypothetical protein
VASLRALIAKHQLETRAAPQQIFKKSVSQTDKNICGLKRDGSGLFWL